MGVFRSMKRNLARISAGLLFAAQAGQALAQTTPNLTYGQVPTAGQWNSYFAAKQDVLGFSPFNSMGGSLGGALFLLPSTTVTAGLNVGIGVAPSVPNNGDIWETAGGLFARINGSNVNLGTGGAAGLAFPAAVSGTVTSGGVPYFSSSILMSSSAALGSGLLVQGGGAGSAPSTFTLGGGCAFATPNLTCSASGLTGTTLAAGVINSSLTSVGVLTSGATGSGFTINLGASTVSGTLPVANTAAETGDVTKPSGSSATTVAKIQGTTVSTPTGTGSVVLQAAPTINQPNVVGDTTAATNPAAGSVGETLTQTGGSTAITSNTITNLTSKSITAGHWNCNVYIVTTPAGSTVTTSMEGALSTANNTLPTTLGAFPSAAFLVSGGGAGGINTIDVGPVRIDPTATTTYYVNVTIIFTTSTMNATGTLICQRIF